MKREDSVLIQDELKKRRIPINSMKHKINWIMLKEKVANYYSWKPRKNKDKTYLL